MKHRATIKNFYQKIVFVKPITYTIKKNKICTNVEQLLPAMLKCKNLVQIHEYLRGLKQHCRDLYMILKFLFFFIIIQILSFY